MWLRRWSSASGENRLHAKNNVAIVNTMVSAFIFSLFVLASFGALLARQPLRAKLLPLLRRAR